MTEALSWPDWKWLFDKANVRDAADRAAEALEAANQSARKSWSDELKNSTVAEQVQEADAMAAKITRDAEAMFEEAEKRLNASLAREAAQKALESFDLREKALAMAEAAGGTVE